MAAASATALAWRPLPLRPISSHSHVNRFRSSTICVTSPRACFSSHYSNGLGCNSIWRPVLDVRLRSPWSNLARRGVVTTRAGMRLDPGGGNNNNNNGDGGIGRVVVNLALAGGLTYLTLTGKLGWVFDTIVSLWLLAVVIPIIGFIAFFWFAEREIVKGACPNCGQVFQVFEFAAKEQPNLCPYCSQPFKLDSERQFVRDEPRFSNQKSGGFGNGFGGFGEFGGFGRESSRTKNEDPGGVIVDVEAEVVDRD